MQPIVVYLPMQTVPTVASSVLLNLPLAQATHVDSSQAAVQIDADRIFACKIVVPPTTTSVPLNRQALAASPPPPSVVALEQAASVLAAAHSSLVPSVLTRQVLLLKVILSAVVVITTWVLLSPINAVFNVPLDAPCVTVTPTFSVIACAVMTNVHCCALDDEAPTESDHLPTMQESQFDAAAVLRP